MVGARVRRQQGRVYPITRSVRPPRVRRALGGTVDVGLPVATGRAGCPGAGRDASFGGPVPRVTDIGGFGFSFDGKAMG